MAMLILVARRSNAVAVPGSTTAIEVLLLSAPTVSVAVKVFAEA